MHISQSTMFIIIVTMVSMLAMCMVYGSLWIKSEYRVMKLTEECSKLRKYVLILIERHETSEQIEGMESVRTQLLQGPSQQIMTHSGSGRFDFVIKAHDEIGRQISAVHEFYIPTTATHAKLMSGQDTLLEWGSRCIEKASTKNGMKVLIPIEGSKPLPIYASGQPGTLAIVLDTPNNSYPMTINALVSQHRIEGSKNFRDGARIMTTGNFFKSCNYYPASITSSREVVPKVEWTT